MKKLSAAIAATLAISAQATMVSAITGNDLLSRIEADSPFRQGHVIGFVTGVADVLSASSVICFPAGSTVGQSVDVVATWLRRNPARRHEGGYMLVADALGEAFPCPRREKSSAGRPSL